MEIQSTVQGYRNRCSEKINAIIQSFKRFSLSEKERLLFGYPILIRAILFQAIENSECTEIIEYICEHDAVKADNLLRGMRRRSIDNFFNRERSLLDKGECTYKWSVNQMRELYNFDEEGMSYQNAGEVNKYDMMDHPVLIPVQGRNGDTKMMTCKVEIAYVNDISFNPRLVGNPNNNQINMYIGKESESMQECFERIRSAVERLTGELDYWPEGHCVFNPPATEHEIETLERQYGLMLPDEYKEFLRFSNGAKICGHSCTIYGTDMFGAGDAMVPDPLYAVGKRIGDGERIALDPRVGELYSCYNWAVKLFSLEIEMCRLVEECEEGVIECERQIAEAKKTPEQKQKEAEEHAAFLAELDRLIEEARSKNK